MVRFAYNQGPHAVYWWLDRYADFDEVQAPHVREAIERWFAWHRATQLPSYVESLARARREATAPLTAGQACAWFDELRRNIRTGFGQALPALAEQAAQLTPQQLQHIERRYRVVNDELRHDYLQPDLGDRHRADLDRIVERAEMLYGNLDDAQRDMIGRRLADSPFDAQRWLDERIERQRETLGVLRRITQERPPAQQAQQALAQLLDHAEASPRADYRAYQRRLIDFNCDLAARIHEQTTPAQRRAAAERLGGWERDLRSLIDP